MSLHPPVLFLGDRPNPKKNLDLDVAFVGSPSYRELLMWIYKLDVDISMANVVNCFNVDGTPTMSDIVSSDVGPLRVITLGPEAKAWLDKVNEERLFPIPNFQMPKPQGTKRDPLEKKRVSDLLVRCRKFIHGG